MVVDNPHARGPRVSEGAKSDQLLERVVAAIVASSDGAAIEEAIARARGSTSPSPPTTMSTSTSTATATTALASKLLLLDVLDDTILGARSGDRPYPLRLLLTHLGESLDGAGFDLACALNVFFRVDMDDEAKMRLGVETSRLYYRFVRDRANDPGLVSVLSPLVASLLSGQLERLRFESVDHQKIFDSALHERAADSDGGSAAIREPLTFLCRVSATGMVRARATVRT
jgi:hypothetical protein